MLIVQKLFLSKKPILRVHFSMWTQEAGYSQGDELSGWKPMFAYQRILIQSL